MGETMIPEIGERFFPLDFEPQCPQFAWMKEHLGGLQLGQKPVGLAEPQIWSR